MKSPLSPESLSSAQLIRVDRRPIPGPAIGQWLPGFITAFLAFCAATMFGLALYVTSTFLPEVIVIRWVTGFINLGVAAMLVTAPFLSALRWRIAWRIVAVLVPILFLAVYSSNRVVMQFPNGARVFAHLSMFPFILANIVLCGLVMGFVTWVRPTFVHSPGEAPTFGFSSRRYGLLPLAIVVTFALAAAALLAWWVATRRDNTSLEMLTVAVLSPTESLLFLAGFFGGVPRFRQVPLVITCVAVFILCHAITFFLTLHWSNPFIVVTWMLAGIPFDLFITFAASLILGWKISSTSG